MSSQRGHIVPFSFSSLSAEEVHSFLSVPFSNSAEEVRPVSSAVEVQQHSVFPTQTENKSTSAEEVQINSFNLSAGEVQQMSAEEVHSKMLSDCLRDEKWMDGCRSVLRGELDMLTADAVDKMEGKEEIKRERIPWGDDAMDVDALPELEEEPEEDMPDLELAGPILPMEELRENAPDVFERQGFGFALRRHFDIKDEPRVFVDMNAVNNGNCQFHPDPAVDTDDETFEDQDAKEDRHDCRCNKADGNCCMCGCMPHDPLCEQGHYEELMKIPMLKKHLISYSVGERKKILSFDIAIGHEDSTQLAMELCPPKPDHVLWLHFTDANVIAFGTLQASCYNGDNVDLCPFCRLDMLQCVCITQFVPAAPLIGIEPNPGPVEAGDVQLLDLNAMSDDDLEDEVGVALIDGPNSVAAHRERHDMSFGRQYWNRYPKSEFAWAWLLLQVVMQGWAWLWLPWQLAAGFTPIIFFTGTILFHEPRERLIGWIERWVIARFPDKIADWCRRKLAMINGSNLTKALAVQGLLVLAAFLVVKVARWIRRDKKDAKLQAFGDTNEMRRYVNFAEFCLMMTECYANGLAKGSPITRTIRRICDLVLSFGFGFDPSRGWVDLDRKGPNFGGPELQMGRPEDVGKSDVTVEPCKPDSKTDYHAVPPTVELSATVDKKTDKARAAYAIEYGEDDSITAKQFQENRFGGRVFSVKADYVYTPSSIGDSRKFVRFSEKELSNFHAAFFTVDDCDESLACVTMDKMLYLMTIMPEFSLFRLLKHPAITDGRTDCFSKEQMIAMQKSYVDYAQEKRRSGGAMRPNFTSCDSDSIAKVGESFGVSKAYKALCSGYHLVCQQFPKVEKTHLAFLTMVVIFASTILYVARGSKGKRKERELSKESDVLVLPVETLSMAVKSKILEPVVEPVKPVLESPGGSNPEIDQRYPDEKWQKAGDLRRQAAQDVADAVEKQQLDEIRLGKQRELDDKYDEMVEKAYEKSREIRSGLYGVGMTRDTLADDLAKIRGMRSAAQEQLDMRFAQEYANFESLAVKSEAAAKVDGQVVESGGKRYGTAPERRKLEYTKPRSYATILKRAEMRTNSKVAELQPTCDYLNSCKHNRANLKFCVYCMVGCKGGCEKKGCNAPINEIHRVMILASADASKPECFEKYWKMHLTSFMCLCGSCESMDASSQEGYQNLRRRVYDDMRRNIFAKVESGVVRISEAIPATVVKCKSADGREYSVEMPSVPVPNTMLVNAPRKESLNTNVHNIELTSGAATSIFRVDLFAEEKQGDVWTPIQDGAMIHGLYVSGHHFMPLHFWDKLSTNANKLRTSKIIVTAMDEKGNFSEVTLTDRALLDEWDAVYHAQRNHEQAIACDVFVVPNGWWAKAKLPQLTSSKFVASNAVYQKQLTGGLTIEKKEGRTVFKYHPMFLLSDGPVKLDVKGERYTSVNYVASTQPGDCGMGVWINNTLLGYHVIGNIAAGVQSARRVDITTQNLIKGLAEPSLVFRAGASSL